MSMKRTCPIALGDLTLTVTAELVVADGATHRITALKDPELQEWIDQLIMPAYLNARPMIRTLRSGPCRETLLDYKLSAAQADDSVFQDGCEVKVAALLEGADKFTQDWRQDFVQQVVQHMTDHAAQHLLDKGATPDASIIDEIVEAFREVPGVSMIVVSASPL